ncbi:MAG: DUF4168 domain-containing protein [Gemmatimonadota bacterium]
MRMRPGLQRVLLIGILSLGSVTSVAAQAAAASLDSTVTEAQLTAYAKAYPGIAAARDSAHAHFALSRNKTDELQRELRDGLKKQIEQILQAQGLTQDAYTRITFVISRDEALRKRFDELLAAAAPKPR